MLIAYEGFGLILLAAYLFTLVDIVMSDAGSVRNLPKVAWFFIVLATFEIGVILWFIAGRPQGATASMLHQGRGTPRDRRPARSRGYPEHDRPGAAQNPDDDADYQAQLRRRIDEQRRRAQEPDAP